MTMYPLQHYNLVIILKRVLGLMYSDIMFDSRYLELSTIEERFLVSEAFQYKTLH